MAGLLEGAQEGGLGGEGNAAVVVVFVAASVDDGGEDDVTVPADGEAPEVAVVAVVDETTVLAWDSEQAPPEPSRLLVPLQPAFWLFQRTISVAPVLRGQARVVIRFFTLPAIWPDPGWPNPFPGSPMK